MSSIFRYQLFVAVSGNLGGKVPVVDDVLSSHEQEIYPTTSLDENCIEFEFQTDRNYCVGLRQTYLALKLKLVRGRDYETYNTKEAKKEHRKEERRQKQKRKRRRIRRLQSSGYSCKQHYALSFFPMLTCTSTISKFTTLEDCMRTNLTFPTASREPSLNTSEFCTATGTTMKNFLMKLWKRLCRNLFSQGEGKCLADLMASCCMVNWGLTFSPLLNCYTKI